MPYHGHPPTAFYYRHWTSDAPKSVVLLLHGFGEHSGYFHRFAAELTRAASDVWAPDHVGHGLSGQHDGLFESVEQLASNAELLLRDIDSEHPDLPLFIVGHSLGALTGVQMAARSPKRLSGLVLTGPAVAGRPDPMPDDPIFSQDPSYCDDATHDPLAISAPNAVENLRRAVSEFLPRLSSLVPLLDVPTLVVYGEHDVFTGMDTARRWTAELPHGELIVVPDSYHDILNDRSHRLVAAKICQFIEKYRAQQTVGQTQLGHPALDRASSSA